MAGGGGAGFEGNGKGIVCGRRLSSRDGRLPPCPPELQRRPRRRLSAEQGAAGGRLACWEGARQRRAGGRLLSRHSAHPAVGRTQRPRGASRASARRRRAAVAWRHVGLVAGTDYAADDGRRPRSGGPGAAWERPGGGQEGAPMRGHEDPGRSAGRGPGDWGEGRRERPGDRGSLSRGEAGEACVVPLGRPQGEASRGLSGLSLPPRHPPGWPVRLPRRLGQRRPFVLSCEVALCLP